MTAAAVNSADRATIDADQACGKPHSRRPIRILHSVGHLNRGGIENWLFQVVSRMDRRRFEHHVLVRTEQEEPFTYAFEQAGVRVIPCLGVTSPLRFRRNFLRLIDQNGPYDALHAHGFGFLTLQALLHSKLCGIPLRIMHSHDDLRPRLAHAGRIYRWYAGLALEAIRQLANAGIACGRQAGEWVFGAQRVYRGKSIPLIIGIEMEPCFQAADPTLRGRLGIPADSFVILHIGRFEVQKNHAFTVEIAKELEARSCPFQLLLIGKGSLRQEMERRMIDAGVQNRCTWIDDTAEVPKILRSVADLKILPSLHEGLPLVHIETQAAAVPILISNTVTSEAVIDPDLVEFLPIDKGPRIWADRIVERLGQGKRRQITTEHRGTMLASRFNIDVSLRQLTAIYESIANQES
jgi:glycosyltransferase involved in cell wall biosynthesis